MEKEIELFNHQVKAINAVSGKENVGFFLEMGLGKSITGICQCLIFDNPRTLLICPKSLILTWKNTFSQFFPELKVTDLEDYQKAEKSIEKDEEFIKLYNMTVQKYLDEGLDPNDITFSQIIELDFDYFARSYGVKCFVVREKNRNITFIDV